MNKVLKNDLSEENIDEETSMPEIYSGDQYYMEDNELTQVRLLEENSVGLQTDHRPELVRHRV